MSLPASVRVHALVPAAGRGTRMGAALPKQYLTLRGKTIAEHSLQRLLAVGRIDTVVVVVADDDHWWQALPISGHSRVPTVTGGATRAHSVLNGLKALQQGATKDDWVLVHDVARPCVRLSDIQLLLKNTGDQGALLALPVTDTLKQADEQKVQATLDRQQIWRALTPQLFPLTALHDALEQALEQKNQITDESSAMESIGWQPVLVPGHGDNLKITRPEDLPLAEFWLQQQKDEGLRWQDGV